MKAPTSCDFLLAQLQAWQSPFTLFPFQTRALPLCHLKGGHDMAPNIGRKSENLVAGGALITTGIVEAIVMGGPCPLCIGAIGAGAATIIHEFKKPPVRP